jgi:GT2 family glycosyltransferase
LAEPAITVAIPSIRGGPLLLACLESLRRQTYSGFETVVIDNSGTGFMESELAGKFSEIRLRVFRNERNVGFGAAVNRAFEASQAEFLATLNDDAEASPEWLAAMVVEMRSAKDVGMCASQVRLFGTERLDSAGMLIALDGSSKQRGQGQPAEKYLRAEDVLLPSASAALYRREMLEDIGLFDEDFFLYCEDTDLGLRGRRNGWRCRYAPQAVVDHHYSQSSGAVSALKAWYVERNRLWVLAKNFPRRALWAVPVHAILRYFWHTWYLLRGEGSAGRVSGSAGFLSLAGMVVRAHFSLFKNFAVLGRKRKAIQKSALLNDRQFLRLLKDNAIGEREIARL